MKSTLIPFYPLWSWTRVAVVKLMSLVLLSDLPFPFLFLRLFFISFLFFSFLFFFFFMYSQIPPYLHYLHYFSFFLYICLFLFFASLLGGLSVRPSVRRSVSKNHVSALQPLPSRNQHISIVNPALFSRWKFVVAGFATLHRGMLVGRSVGPLDGPLLGRGPEGVNDLFFHTYG